MTTAIPHAVRLLVLSRAGYHCEDCGAAATRAEGAFPGGIHLHHKVRLEEGGTHAPENLAALCHRCHARRHREMDGKPPATPFGRLVLEALAGRSPRQARDVCGLSHEAIYRLLRGALPRRPTLVRFADNLELDAPKRERLFRAAGYLDPAEDRQPVGVGS